MKKLSMNELGRISLAEFKANSKTPIVVILDNIRSMNNIGSVFRTSDAFAIEHIYLCGITACPPHKEIAKTALGATESIDWSYDKETSNTIMQLKKLNYRIFAVEQTDHSVFLQNFKPDFQHKTALIFGNEVFGVSDNLLPLCDGCIEIPQIGTKHSLNIAVSAGIVLWDLYSKYIKTEHHHHDLSL